MLGPVGYSVATVVGCLTGKRYPRYSLHSRPVLGFLGTEEGYNYRVIRCSAPRCRCGGGGGRNGRPPKPPCSSGAAVAAWRQLYISTVSCGPFARPWSWSSKRSRPFCSILTRPAPLLPQTYWLLASPRTTRCCSFRAATCTYVSEDRGQGERGRPRGKSARGLGRRVRFRAKGGDAKTQYCRRTSRPFRPLEAVPRDARPFRHCIAFGIGHGKPQGLPNHALVRPMGFHAPAFASSVPPDTCPESASGGPGGASLSVALQAHSAGT